MKKLSDLPTLAEIKELNQVNPDLFDALERMQSQGQDQPTGQEDEETGEVTNESDTAEQDADTDNEADFPEDEQKVVPFTG